MIKRFLQVASVIFLFNHGLISAVPSYMLSYDQALLAKAIAEDQDDLSLELIHQRIPSQGHYVLDIIDSYKRHPFLDAIARGDIQQVAASLAAGFAFKDIYQSVLRMQSWRKEEFEIEKAWQVAIKYAPNSEAMLKLLLEAGLDVEESSHYNQRQLGNEEDRLISQEESLLTLIHRYQKFDLVSLLVPYLDRPSFYQEEDSVTELSYVSATFDQYFRHPLLEALKKGKLELVREMIQAGVEWQYVSQGVIRSNGEQEGIFELEGPFQIAIKYAPDSEEAVKLLLEAGLTPTASLFPYIPRSEFLKACPQSVSIDLVQLAIEYQKPGVVEVLQR